MPNKLRKTKIGQFYIIFKNLSSKTKPKRTHFLKFSSKIKTDIFEDQNGQRPEKTRPKRTKTKRGKTKKDEDQRCRPHLYAPIAMLLIRTTNIMNFLNFFIFSSLFHCLQNVLQSYIHSF